MKKKSDDINEERVINYLLINDVVTEPSIENLIQEVIQPQI